MKVMENGAIGVPKWIPRVNLAVRSIEINNGVRFQIRKYFMVRELDNDGQPTDHNYGSDGAIVQNGKNYYKEDRYQFCNFTKDEESIFKPREFSSELRVYGPFGKAEIIDCETLEEDQFFRWNWGAKVIEPDADKMFGKPVIQVAGTITDDGYPAAYISRDECWKLSSYYYYVCVWVIQAIRTQGVAWSQSVFPALPAFLVYVQDSMSQFRDADMHSMPFGWSGNVFDDSRFTPG